MPPKKAAKKPVAAKNYKLPDPLPSGLILTDILKNQWRLGKSIGQGGFGEIYTASNIVQKAQSEKSDYVIKIEPHSNGPLFVEMHCYMKIAKPDSIESWKKTKKLKHLGMPKYFGSGSHEYKGQKYRFMVMQRFGQDLQKIINKHEKMFSYKTVFQVVIQILDVLEYIHSHGYIHADIKASNLLVGYQKGTESDVYLVDYGLACRYAQPDGRHKEYKYDQRKAHDGTIEFTSRDAHIGAHSRRGDLEILGYNLVQWLCGRLPWEDNLQDCDYVANKKRLLMDDIPRFMKLCFPDGVPPGIPDFMKYVASLTFDEKPSYEKCKAILREGLKKRGHTDDGKLVFLSATPKTNPRLFNGKKVSAIQSPDMFESDFEATTSPSTPSASTDSSHAITDSGAKKRKAVKKRPNAPPSKKTKKITEAESSEQASPSIHGHLLSNGTGKRRKMTPNNKDLNENIPDAPKPAKRQPSKRSKSLSSDENSPEPTKKQAKVAEKNKRKPRSGQKTSPLSKKATKNSPQISKNSTKKSPLNKKLPKSKSKSKPKMANNFDHISNPTPAMLAIMNKTKK